MAYLFGDERKIREKCSTLNCDLCRIGGGKCDSIIFMEEYGAYSYETGWSGEIYCEGCGRRVEYVGTAVEKKADVERILRKLWHVANEEASNG